MAETLQATSLQFVRRGEVREWLKRSASKEGVKLSAPIQSVPSRAASRLLIEPDGNYWPPGGCPGTFLTPSKRDKPKPVPRQR